MLIAMKDLHGYTLHASDGEIGKVDEVLFDDEHWAVRYLIVDTGDWLQGRKELIAPVALGSTEWVRHILNVNLTREQVENSPSADTYLPMSRQWETDYYDYYAWPYYWSGMGGTGATMYPGFLVNISDSESRDAQQAVDDRAWDRLSKLDRGDVHLRSSKEVTGYGISASDGHLGHVDDFIVDDKTWRIRYLAVDTRDWWPGKKVLLPPEWVGKAIWPDRTVTMDFTRDQVKNGPEWDSHEAITPAFEKELSDYYALQHRVSQKIPAGRM